jgi:hypothetical protein
MAAYASSLRGEGPVVHTLVLWLQQYLPSIAAHFLQAPSLPSPPVALTVRARTPRNGLGRCGGGGGGGAEGRWDGEARGRSTIRAGGGPPRADVPAHGRHRSARGHGGDRGGAPPPPYRAPAGATRRYSRATTGCCGAHTPSQYSCSNTTLLRFAITQGSAEDVSATRFPSNTASLFVRSRLSSASSLAGREESEACATTCGATQARIHRRRRRAGGSLCATHGAAGSRSSAGTGDNTHLSTCSHAQTSNERKVGKVAHQGQGALR